MTSGPFWSCIEFPCGMMQFNSIFISFYLPCHDSMYGSDLATEFQSSSIPDQAKILHAP